MDKFTVGSDVELVIQRTLDFQVRYPYSSVQLTISDGAKNIEFLKFCKHLSEHCLVDELGGNESSWQRRSSKKKFDDVIDKAHSGFCGIKINNVPAFKASKWEMWPGGYIECFVRMNGESAGHEYFIWLYIRMVHFKSILEKYGKNLEYLYF